MTMAIVARAQGRLRAIPASLEVVMGAAGTATFIMAWELLPRAEVIDPRFLPPFSDTVSAMWAFMQSSVFWTAFWQTIRGWSIGLAIAASAAVVVGVIIGSTPVLRRVTSSTIEFLRPIPSVALIPLAVLLYGTEMRATLLLVVYASFWQMLLQVLAGVQDVDPVARDTAKAFGLGWFRRARSVTWPSALPYVMTGFRLSATVALILEITGELVIGTPGLGELLAVSQTSGAVDSIYAIVVVTGGLGMLVNTAARSIERSTLRWHPSIRTELPL